MSERHELNDRVIRFNALDKCGTCGDGIPWVNRKARKVSRGYCSSEHRKQRFVLCVVCTARHFARRLVPRHLRGLH